MTDEMETTEEDREEGQDGPEPADNFDEDLQYELDRGEFAGEGKTVEGEIRGTGEWTDGEPITLRVWTPLGDPNVFTETMDVPPADEPLDTSKFGRILEDYGYSRGSATHLVGDEIDVSYDGEWRVVDPAPPASGADDAIDPDRDPVSSDAPDAAVEPSQSSRTEDPSSTPRKWKAIRSSLLKSLPLPFSSAVSWWLLNNEVSIPSSGPGVAALNNIIPLVNSFFVLVFLVGLLYIGYNLLLLWILSSDTAMDGKRLPAAANFTAHIDGENGDDATETGDAGEDTEASEDSDGIEQGAR